MFAQVRQEMDKQFKAIADTGVLFYAQPDRDKIWEVYLDSFTEETKQGNNCNCCRSFLRQYGGIVGIKDNKVITLWDFESPDPEYANAIKALRKYIVSLPITGIFLNTFPKCGTKQNFDHVRNVQWSHFYVEIPSTFVKRDIGPAQAEALGNKDVLKRSLNEITDDAVDTTLELIQQGSLYRGNEFKVMLTEFRKLKEAYKKVKGENPKDNFCWIQSTKVHASVTRIRNTSIGTLLNDLSEGRDLDGAVSAFERVVAPANYKRPTALVTPRMIADAKKRLEELGLVGSLSRRLLANTDLTVDNALFVHRPTQVGGDIFEQLTKDVTINPKSLTKVEEISINDFVSKVLPTTKSIKVLLENQHLGNFVSLVGPKEKEDKTLFKWGNNYSWSYTGEVADSIKERVKNAGGKVDGVLRVSLSWHNHDDLDLHLIEPKGYEIYFANKRTVSPSGGQLDVDMNAGYGTSREPVENIAWKNLPTQEGKYRVVVNNYSYREATNVGFEVEIEFDGEIYNFTSPTNGTTGKNFTIVEFNYSKKDGVTFIGKSGTPSKYPSKEKWGVKTGQFHQVKAITLSPNYWNAEVGNKHFMFFLEGCKSEDKTRAFYNEFLQEELLKDRKVFEILGSKATVEPVEEELSGVGFSDTIKTDLIVEVEGSFKRTLKIKF